MIKCFVLSGSFGVWLTKAMVKMISGYIERVNGKAAAAYYEIFTNISLSCWTYSEV